ncbi:Rho protein [Cladophialophora carrionii]|uniref:Rho protein n=1 Tax=Cladophialophora carrionii TaxID=86049 RepID=A0A1C1CEF0_9EURO|nr:Rho protein [Cladophialophora carrionii]
MTTQILTGKPIPEVDILFLGSPGVGKATFLSRLPHIRNGKLDLSAVPKDGRVFAPSGPLTFDVALYGRRYRFRIHASTSTLFIDPFPPRPSFAIIAFSIPHRESLHNAQYYWRKQLSLHYHDLEHTMPVMLLGLKRDERTEERLETDTDTDTGSGSGGGSGGGSGRFKCVMPQEGLQAAQEMRCDRYAECSALTGELMFEVLEDITKTAARTTTEAGGLSQNGSCDVM